MITDIGQKVRTLRKKCGYSLHDLANKLGVSAGYLSNLETGKSETIQLSLLQQLQDEFALFSLETMKVIKDDDEFELRLLHINHLLRKINKENPDQSEYLLSLVEKGADLFDKNNQKS
ncbi:helix-turn-helix domain-containing protein [Bacillus suaedaesalsae]|uniref:Helix-turn-helix transcriptional regulator n=1 Tax=Bacillus suaedaesalsae TaxID=2810349 RepID=A0ABS2DFN3_9BACI|nr:helix-turn-helix transcriptional regulator [Bacillus suaedaesalsae]MBM6617286.1 helix-turn-helix transcriptional regulator [Bacillus suaedaesalsae]